MLFRINIITGILSIIFYLVPFCNPMYFAGIGFLGLLIPVFLSFHLFFFVYWLTKLDKKLFFSVVLLLIGIGYVPFILQINFSKNTKIQNDPLKIMSYNVRLFNKYGWLKKKNIPQKMIHFIREQSPDIVCFQEYTDSEPISKFLKNHFPYEHKIISAPITGMGQAMFSKFPMIKKGNLKFRKSFNNAIFVDIIKKKDTFRIYNIHLESFGGILKDKNFGAKTKTLFVKKMASTFKKQAEQTKIILAHVKTSAYPTIFAGDFNNSPFSWVYKKLKKNKNDAFLESGAGFGSTYDIFVPLRIDFILTDKIFEIQSFETYSVKYADHFPIMATLNIKNKSF